MAKTRRQWPARTMRQPSTRTPRGESKGESKEQKGWTTWLRICTTVQGVGGWGDIELYERFAGLLKVACKEMPATSGLYRPHPAALVPTVLSLNYSGGKTRTICDSLGFQVPGQAGDLVGKPIHPCGCIGRSCAHHTQQDRLTYKFMVYIRKISKKL